MDRSASPPYPRSDDPGRARPSRPWIALVDDTGTASSGLGESLVANGVAAELVRIADEPALERLERGSPPRLTLLATKLACASPESVFLRLRCRHGGRHMPVVMLAETMRPGEAAYWRLLGADDCCDAPDVGAIGRTVACLLSAAGTESPETT